MGGGLGFVLSYWVAQVSAECLPCSRTALGHTQRQVLYPQRAPLTSDIVPSATHFLFGGVHILGQLLILIFQ